jgi:hypothetical protein
MYGAGTVGGAPHPDLVDPSGQVRSLDLVSHPIAAVLINKHACQRPGGGETRNEPVPTKVIAGDADGLAGGAHLQAKGRQARPGTRVADSWEHPY